MKLMLNDGKRDMAKKKKAKQDKEDEMFWFLACNYIAWSLGLLSSEKEETLNAMDQPGALDWKAHVEEQLEIDGETIRGIAALCTKRMPPEKAISFIVYGLAKGRPDPLTQFLSCKD